MPVPSNYLINFTDPAKTAITVLGGDKNGPGFVTQDTSIVLLGQYAPLYGEDINENFLHLLENFSNSSPPNVPIQGQLWYSNDDTYDNRSLSAANVQYQGDFYFRVRTKDALGSEFWALPRGVLVDDNIGNLTSYNPLPGDLWIDTSPTSINGAKTGVSWIGVPERNWNSPELKIFDADTGKFESIGRNYVKLNDNASQTITSNITLVGTLSVSGLSTLNATTATTLLVSSTATFTTSLTVGTDLFVNHNLIVDNSSIFHNDIVIDNNSLLTSNGNCIFNNGNFITLNSNSLSILNSLDATSSSVVVHNELVVGTDVSLTNFGLTGSGNINGNVSIYGTGYGNLSVSGETSLHVTSTKQLYVDGILSTTDTLYPHFIDMQGTRIVSLGTPNSYSDAVNRGYVDDNYVRLNSTLGSYNNTMSAVLVLTNVGQNSSSNNAATVGYVDYHNSLYVKKSGDNIVSLDITHPTFGLSVAGGAQFSSFISAISLTVSETTDFGGRVGFGSDVYWNVTGRTLDLSAGYIRNLLMTPNPLNDEATNVGYVNTNFSRINPLLPVTPKNGDIRTSNGIVEIFVNGAWATLQTTNIQQVAPGTVQLFAGYAPPSGWLECNGGLLPYVGYEALYGAIGTIYGGSPLISFNVPDLRGEFVRGWSNGSSVDSGRTIGSHQSSTSIADAVASHISLGLHNTDGIETTESYNANSGSGITGTRTYYNIRPRNVAMMYIIKT